MHSLCRKRVMDLVAARCLAKHLSKQLSTTTALGGYGGKDVFNGAERQLLPIQTSIGKREVVGPGRNNLETYIDDTGFAFPAVRFREDNPEILKLKEKEKGDWKKLTMEEKKALYRASFCQTFAEINAPSGSWKSIFGYSFVGFAASIFLFILLDFSLYRKLELPWTMLDEEHQTKQIQRMVDLQMNPVEGLASKWDQDKQEWKK